MHHPGIPDPEPDTPIFAAFIGAAAIIVVALLLQMSGPPGDVAAMPPLLDAELAAPADALPVPNFAQAPH